MQKELEEQINDEKNGNEIKLTGKIRLTEAMPRLKQT